MSTVDVIVIALGGVLAVGAVWLFLGRAVGSTGPSRGAAHEVRVVLRRGFHPDVILVETGQLVRLHFFRDESAAPSERVVCKDLHIDQLLAAYETTVVEFTPARSGDYRFECGPCSHGVVAAQVGGETARANLGRGHNKHG